MTLCPLGDPISGALGILPSKTCHYAPLFIYLVAQRPVERANCLSIFEDVALVGVYDICSANAVSSYGVVVCPGCLNLCTGLQHCLFEGAALVVCLESKDIYVLRVVVCKGPSLLRTSGGSGDVPLKTIVLRIVVAVVRIKGKLLNPAEIPYVIDICIYAVEVVQLVYITYGFALQNIVDIERGI